MWNKIQRIYIGTEQIRPVYKREPWANTIAYYKFVSDVNDYSWNNYNLAWGGTFSNNMITSTSTLYYNWNSLFWQDYGGDFTVMGRMDYTKSASDSNMYFICDKSYRPSLATNDAGDGWGWSIYKGYSQSGYGWVTTPSSWGHWSVTWIHHTALVRIWNTFYSYWDWVQATDTLTMTGYIWAWNSNNEKWPRFASSGWQLTFRTITLWEVIMENRWWSSTEMLEYFKWTKKMYGL